MGAPYDHHEELSCIHHPTAMQNQGYYGQPATQQPAQAYNGSNAAPSYGYTQAPYGQEYGQQPQQQQYQQYGSPQPGGQGIPPNAMQQQQYPQYEQYQQPPPQQPDYSSKPSEQGEKFAPSKPKWNDLFFFILFWAHFAAFVALSVIALRTVANAGGSITGDASNGLTLNLNTAYLLALIAAAGFVLAILLLFLAKTFTKVILEISLFLAVAMSVGYAIYLWIEKFWSGAIIFTIFAIFSIIAYFPMRRRIPLSRLLLQFVFKIAKKHPSVYVIAILTTVIQAAYSVWWSFTVVALYQKYSPDSASGCSTTGGSCGSASLIISVIFAVFSFYWTTQVISNVALTTIAGIFGSFYFSLPDVVQKHVTLSSFRRTMTYSFGSIAEGSLIVALLDVLRAALTLLKNQEAASGDTMGAAIACCASCCVGCIRGLVDYFNRYAYIEIAMFGKKYTEAAKDAWNLLKKRGIDALVNDCLVNNIWTFGSFACGAICSFFAYIYLHQVRPSYIADNSNYYSIILLYAFLVGFQITHSLGYVALSSGVSTIFVALGEAPQALAEKDPELFAHIAHAYPQVVTPV